MYIYHALINALSAHMIHIIMLSMPSREKLSPELLASPQWRNGNRWISR